MAKEEKPVEETAPTERHRDIALEEFEIIDDQVLEPDFEAEETDETEDVFGDDLEEGPDVDVDPNENLPEEETA